MSIKMIDAITNKINLYKEHIFKDSIAESNLYKVLESGSYIDMLAFLQEAELSETNYQLLINELPINMLEELIVNIREDNKSFKAVITLLKEKLEYLQITGLATDIEINKIKETIINNPYLQTEMIEYLFKNSNIVTASYIMASPFTNKAVFLNESNENINLIIEEAVKNYAVNQDMEDTIRNRGQELLVVKSKTMNI